MERDTIYLTFDIDWACDEILEDTIAIIEKAGIAATFFATHSSNVINNLAQNAKLELGIHPNFNHLLTGDCSAGVEKVISTIKEIVPQAVSVRSHSLTQSSYILDCFRKFGLTHDVNLYIPVQSGIQVSAFYHWNGLVRVPFIWEDDVHCMNMMQGMSNGWEVHRLLKSPGLKVFNFHPIHVYLNTEELSRYNASKQYYSNPKELLKYRYHSFEYGTRVFLNSLISEAKKLRMRFGLINEVKV